MMSPKCAEPSALVEFIGKAISAERRPSTEAFCHYLRATIFLKRSGQSQTNFI